MIPDYLMIFGAYSLMVIAAGFLTPFLSEKIYGSKLAMVIIVGALMLYGSLITHTHTCKDDYVKECEKSYRLAMGYNYCINQSYDLNNPGVYDTFCLYDMKIKCNFIPDGCIDKSLENIDGYCFLPYVCFLFNKP